MGMHFLLWGPYPFRQPHQLARREGLVMRGGGLVGLWAAAGLVCLAAACSRAPDHPDHQSPISKDTYVGPVSGQPAAVGSAASATKPPDETLTIHGWFTIVWNDQAHTFITDDERDTHELLLDECLTASLGGPRRWTAHVWSSPRLR
jgi:hypothetical protein